MENSWAHERKAKFFFAGLLSVAVFGSLCAVQVLHSENLHTEAHAPTPPPRRA